MKTRVKAKAAAVSALDDPRLDPEWDYRNRKLLGERAAAKIRSGEAKSLTEAMIAQRMKAAKSRPITIRLAASDIELAKQRAEKLGIGYQTYLKSLLHQALDTAR